MKRADPLGPLARLDLPLPNLHCAPPRASNGIDSKVGGGARCLEGYSFPPEVRDYQPHKLGWVANDNRLAADFQTQPLSCSNELPPDRDRSCSQSDCASNAPPGKERRQVYLCDIVNVHSERAMHSCVLTCLY